MESDSRPGRFLGVGGRLGGIRFKDMIKDAAEAAAAEEQNTVGFGALKKRMAHDDKTKTL